jgi:hypothetical protein
MDAYSVLDRLDRDGFQVWREGDRLMVAPSTGITAEFRGALHSDRDSLLGALKWNRARGYYAPPDQCPVCGSWSWAILEADPSWFCSDCFPRSAAMTDRKFTATDEYQSFVTNQRRSEAA